MLSKLEELSLLPFMGMASVSPRPFAQEVQQEQSPWWIWLLIILVLLAFAFIVFWWWLRGREEKEQETAVAHQVERAVPIAEPPVKAPTAETEAVVEAEAPVPATVPTEVIPEVPVAPAAPDDLKVVEGIGPKIAAILQASGVMTFAQLAAADPEQIRQILKEANPNLLRLADPVTWPEQARLAAEGQWDALKELQDRLKGGRQS